jgi:hypothetical protein
MGIGSAMLGKTGLNQGASMELSRNRPKVNGGGLAGAIMISGNYDLTATPLADAQHACFGDDPARCCRRSTVTSRRCTRSTPRTRG